jgi:hypothetical protein
MCRFAMFDQSVASKCPTNISFTGSRQTAVKDGFLTKVSRPSILESGFRNNIETPKADVR